ncbi:hypothetical protein [Sphingobium cupriresistens]|uniref:Uncharacterized protein n=1 Tax=Sphingobium cupriresistens TaxID=1132417 RepID=A0A8G2DXH0_9SPHN|nr:hypothetical protein [Sphingobium cupriresistens]RYM04937.1 hypothetical protein EWH12_21680 [Sphingobium cupriresistens]
MAGELRAERDSVLRELTRDEIAHRRSLCASGQMPASVARVRASGFQTLSASERCVTVLTRAGRDGSLRYVSQQDGRITPAIAFDSGFVEAYLKREAVPADTPAMATLLPVADRCLAQNEPNTRLCNTAGYLLGTRAARGELVPVS